MNMEAQAATPKSEGEEKQTNFEANQARAVEIQREIAEAAASGDFAKIAELSAEGQRLKSANENVVDADRQEATEMNAEMDAEKARAEEEAAKKAAEEAAAEQARLSQEATEQVTADQAAADALAAEIKGEAPEEYSYQDAAGEWTTEKPQIPKMERSLERAQEIIDSAKSMSEKSREDAQRLKESGLTGTATEESILLNERNQLLHIMTSGNPSLSDFEKAAIHGRVQEIDSNPAIMARLQEQGEVADATKIENAAGRVWSFMNQMKNGGGVSPLEITTYLEKYTERDQAKIAEKFFGDTVARGADVEAARKVYENSKGLPFATRFEELENERLVSQGEGEITS